jgi:hypothetical protein
MMLTVFRSRLRAEHAAECYETVKRMVEIATKLPGWESTFSATESAGTARCAPAE